MFENSDESIAYILKHHMDDIKSHKADVLNKVRRKKYCWQFKAVLILHLRSFKGFQALSLATGIDQKILRQWMYIETISKRRSKNQEFKQLKVIYRSAHTTFYRK